MTETTPRILDIARHWIQHLDAASHAFNVGDLRAAEAHADQAIAAREQVEARLSALVVTA